MQKSYDERIRNLENDISRYKEKFATGVLNGSDPKNG